MPARVVVSGRADAGTGGVETFPRAAAGRATPAVQLRLDGRLSRIPRHLPANRATATRHSRPDFL
ncbi:hypothetical protein FAGKG844_180053 [Frankia sp. AgKG'84/4]